MESRLVRLAHPRLLLVVELVVAEPVGKGFDSGQVSEQRARLE